MKLLWQVGKGALVLVLVGYGWASGACDAALLQKLLERDFTKAEILQLCGSGPPSSRQEATETPESTLFPAPRGTPHAGRGHRLLDGGAGRQGRLEFPRNAFSG